jgi:hypothetical protein
MREIGTIGRLENENEPLLQVDLNGLAFSFV